jgi:hypothetical protein
VDQHVGHSLSQQKKNFACHVSTDKWVPLVKFAVNWIQIDDLSELQNFYSKVVDFGTKNVK